VRQRERVDERQFPAIGLRSHIRHDKSTFGDNRHFRWQLFKAYVEFVSVNDPVQGIPKITYHLAVA